MLNLNSMAQLVGESFFFNFSSIVLQEVLQSVEIFVMTFYIIITHIVFKRFSKYVQSAYFRN